MLSTDGLTKTCKICGRVRDYPAHFHRKGLDHEGRPRYSSRCRDCATADKRKVRFALKPPDQTTRPSEAASHGSRLQDLELLIRPMECEDFQPGWQIILELICTNILKQDADHGNLD